MSPELSGRCSRSTTLGVKEIPGCRVNPVPAGHIGDPEGFRAHQGSPWDGPPARYSLSSRWRGETVLSRTSDLSSPQPIFPSPSPHWSQPWAPWAWFILSSSRRCWSSPVVLRLPFNSGCQNITSFRLAIQGESQPPPHPNVLYLRHIPGAIGARSMGLPPRLPHLSRKERPLPGHRRGVRPGE